MAKIFKEVKKQFVLEELYIQQRDGKGAIKGDKIFIVSPFEMNLGSVAAAIFDQMPVLSSLLITESMDSPSLHGKLTLIDKDKVFENLKLSPLDLIYVKIREKQTWRPGFNPQLKNLVFSVTSVTQTTEEAVAAKIGPGVSGREIEIEFASNEHYLLNYSYFDFMDQDFIGPISGKNGIIQYLSNKAFQQNSSEFGTAKRPIKADETKNYVWLKRNYMFYPWGKPTFPPRLSSFIQMLTENAVDKNNPNAVNFMFWQDLDGWNFRSIESIINETTDYPTYQFSLHSDDGKAIMSMGFVVEDEPETDFMQLLRSGVFGSNYLLIEPKYSQDPYARYLDTSAAHEMIEIKYDYLEDYDKWKKIEEVPILSDTEYVKTWSHNRQYDQFYGYFEPNYFNRKKSVPWEYYGYTYSNRQEETLWQSMFDITDMDGEILRKIQKEIKEPLAKHRQEYARKMNLKERWKVYRCSVCCAGLMDSDMGTTFTNKLSTYEIVAAGSFTDILNYDIASITGGNNPFQRSGLTLSYNLNESPYNLSLGQFLNLEQNPDNFTKYRFDLEIERALKIGAIWKKNVDNRTSRIDQYKDEFDDYAIKWNVKKTLCAEDSCQGAYCVCPSTDKDVVEKQIKVITDEHEILKTHEQDLNVETAFPTSEYGSGFISAKLLELKEEFLDLYDKFWNRNAFFFSKNMDFSFLKSGNNLFNVKSIKRYPIRGSKYESFATKRTIGGFTFKDGSTLQYPYAVPQDLCGGGVTGNPYYNRSYGSGVKADYWESFDDPLANYPYSDDYGKAPPDGPVWFRNWLVTYNYNKNIPPCITTSAITSSCEECVQEACACQCYGPNTVLCLNGDCSEFGEEGTDYVTGSCSDETNSGFVSQCQNNRKPCTIPDPDFEGCLTVIGTINPSCCDELPGGETWETIEEICSTYPDCPTCEDESIYCCTFDTVTNEYTSCQQYLASEGCPPSAGTIIVRQVSSCAACENPSGSSGVLGALGLLAQAVSSNCQSSDFSVEQATAPQMKMYFETFSNDKESPILTSSQYVTNTIRQKLLGGCDDTNPNCVDTVNVEADGDVQLYHPWGADLVNSGDFTPEMYNDYKSAASLFENDLSGKTAPALWLEGLESFVRIEFRQPIGLESLKDFPEGFVNTPGSEYFLPYIILLTAGPFGAEAARANVSVIGQDPYGFDVAVKKSKNKEDFAGMNLFDYGSMPNLESCNTFTTSSCWLRRSQNVVFYKPKESDYDLFVPMGITDIFAASSLQRSAPVKTWWDLWVSLPPTMMVAHYNRFFAAQPVAFHKQGAAIGTPKVVQSDGGWPYFVFPDTEEIATGAYPSDALILPNEEFSSDSPLGEFLSTFAPSGPISVLKDDPSNYIYKFVEFPNIKDPELTSKKYSIISYPVGTMIYGGNGFTAGEVWRYDSSRKSEYGLVQLNSDSMPSILSLMGSRDGSLEKIQKHYDWLNNKILDWFQNTVFDNNFSAQFVVFAKSDITGCKDYKCANPEGFVNNANCPSNDPLCNCPCQELRPDKITKVKDRLTGALKPGLTSDFGPEPTMLELRKLKNKTNECELIKKVLGEEWLGCVWDDPESPYNCNCPCIGDKFYDYMKYNRTQSTFWSTPLHTPLYRSAQMNLLLANEIQITVPGDLAIKTGQIIFIDGSAETIGGTKKRYHGKWLVYKIDHLMNTGEHMMVMTLVRDSNSNVEGTLFEDLQTEGAKALASAAGLGGLVQ